MLSACPSCLTQVNHEDHLFQVQCETCGNRFNPFLPSEESPGSETAPVDNTFQESMAAFQEVRDFGETLGSGQPEIKPPKPIAKEVQISAPKVADTLTSPTTFLGIVSSGDALQGYGISNYFRPISLLTSLTDDADPLAEAVDLLMKRAHTTGANAVVGFRWAFTADGRVLLSGIPVVAEKSL